ncbi:MAG: hypothetical protein IKN50_00245, partial [Clostridia bacterium]|nr:hypothetical protein [Clostridia bacterium]
MKKAFSLLLAVLMLSGAAILAIPASADGGGELLNVSHPITTLGNPLAVIREAPGTDAYVDALAASPSQILVDGGEITDFGELFAACRGAVAIPVIRVTDAAQVEALYAASEEKSFYDITVISADASLLAAAREKASYIRTGLEVMLPGRDMTSKEAEAVRRATRGAPATFCVIGSEFATADNVRELQALAVAVWVNVGSGGVAEILSAVASGCNGIIGADDGAIAA